MDADRFAELDAQSAEWEWEQGAHGQAVCVRVGPGVVAEVGIDALAEWAQIHDVLVLDEDGDALW